MINEYAGLQTSALTWALAVGLLAIWVLSLPLLVRIREGWEQLFMSLLGLAWIGFGVGMVLRFFVLSYDAETLASTTANLADRPSEVVDLALTTAGLYWMCFVAAVCAIRLVPTPSVLVMCVRRPEALAKRAIVPMSIVAAICLTVSLAPGAPGALITPLSLIGSMWVIPATIVWVGFFYGEPVTRSTLAITLAPGVLRAVLSPYREHILAIALVILVAAVFTGRRLRLAVVVPVATVLILISTVVVTTYRQVIWMGIAPDVAVSRVTLDQWEEQPFDAPWAEILRRFHDFDSLLLTVDLVPNMVPFFERDMLTEAFTRGLIPRFLDPNKRLSDEGLQFQVLIWSFDDDPTREEGSASIAPSMPGSLYGSGGMFEVGVGAVFWGLLMGFLEKFKSSINAPIAAGLQVLWATQALGGIERDFSAAFANIVQMLVMLLVVCFVLGRREPLPELTTLEPEPAAQ